MSHTPGPWKVVGTEIWAGSRRITTGRGAYDEKDRVVRDANARLIAAAPDLLAVLRPIERQMDEDTMFPGPVYLSASEANAIVEAIAKATQ